MRGHCTESRNVPNHQKSQTVSHRLRFLCFIAAPKKSVGSPSIKICRFVSSSFLDPLSSSAVSVEVDSFGVSTVSSFGRTAASFNVLDDAVDFRFDSRSALNLVQ